MNQLAAILILIGGVLVAQNAHSQEPPVWQITPLTDHIYQLAADGGGYTVKVIASVGPDGVLIVDSGKRKEAEALQRALQELGGLPRIIINTHSHIEHTAGNVVFGKAPVIIAHEKVRSRLLQGSFLFDEFTEDSVPEITFTDSLTLHFNGEPIRLIAFPGAHDESDIIVWFTGSKVVCVGALCNGRHFPSVDSRGDVLKYPEVTQRVIDLLPEDVQIIPGHGENGTMADFRAFHDMLAKTTEIVRQGVAQGKSKSQLQQEDVLRDWASFEGSYTDRQEWLGMLADRLERADSPPDDPSPFFETMYHALKEKGVEGAIARYRELKAAGPAGYSLGEETLIYIPYKLYENGRYPEALRFFELCASEHPQGQYASFCHRKMGDIHRLQGHPDLAIASYRKCLEVDPKDARAAQALEELQRSPGERPVVE